MNLKIWGASTLKSFTAAIESGFLSQNVTFDSSLPYDRGIAQIHASPEATFEDEEILREAQAATFPVIFLIHRPDEMLHHEVLKVALAGNDVRFILLGDLVFSLPFWAERRSQCTVIPHPFLDISVPKLNDKFIVGTFTSWGNMRKLEHYLGLVDELKSDPQFVFRIGGTGLEKLKIPKHVEEVGSLFLPHFNVQLYHLQGNKRLGESSGSLHRGVSIPVIFEANGAERIENLKVVKLSASSDLHEIDYKGAAQEIRTIAREHFSEYLAHNLQAAQLNSLESFAKSVLKLL